MFKKDIFPKELRFALIYAIFIYYPLIFTSKKSLYYVLDLMSGVSGVGWGCNFLYTIILGTIAFMYGFRVRSYAHLPRMAVWTLGILLPLIIYAITSNLNHTFDIYTLADISTALAPVLIALVGAAGGTAAGGLK
ncbi:MAG: hypothetical protein IJR45_03110 [Firmicutes bacterium]|nr:hypothetical protein [Bacillota bacterium]MBQ9604382.1 hypothetical protein [Bacillota bacterium]